MSPMNWMNLSLCPMLIFLKLCSYNQMMASKKTTMMYFKMKKTKKWMW